MDDFDLGDDFDNIDDVAGVNDTDWTVKLTETCRECGRKFPGADRNGGHCATCHYSFASQTGFDKHRVGSYSAGRTCQTPEQLIEKGWTLDDHGVYRMPAPTFWSKDND